MQDEFIAIPTNELGAVSGGASPSSWDEYVNGERSAVAGDYKKVVCAAAGVKGGPDFARQVYGRDRTNGSDMIRAAETLKSVCTAGRRLPAQAPPTPF